METGPSPAITVSAEELSREYAKDQSATNAKYQEKYLIINGEVTSTKAYQESSMEVFLKGQDNVIVRGVFAKKDAEALKPGQKINFVGEYLGTGGPKQVSLHMCRLIPQTK